MAEEPLLEKEAKYRAVFDNAAIGIDLADRNGRFVEANAAIANMLGYAREELLTLTVLDITHPDDVEASRERFEAMIRGDIDSYRVLKRYIRKDGSTMWGDLSVSAFRGAGGEQVAAMGVTADVTERVRVEDACQASEVAYRSLAENIPGIVYRCQLDGPVRMEFYNRMLEPMTGFAEDELKEGDVCSIDPLMLPEDRSEAIRAVQDALAKNTPFEIEYRIRHKNGEIRHFSEYGRPMVGPLGSPSYIDGVIFDVTERKKAEKAVVRSEQKYRTLFEESLDPAFVVDFDGTLLEANQALLDLFGHTREELIGQSVLKTYADPADREHYRSEINSKGFVKDYPLKLRTKDGREIDCLFSASVQRDKEGNIVGHRGFIRDVTAQKALERQLVQAQKMEAVGTLAGGVAHDFNNLLQVILGYSELLLTDRDTPPQLRDDLSRVHNAARSGADLVQRLLTFSRKTEITLRPMNLNHEIEQVHQFLTRTIPKMIEIELTLARDLAAINSDRTQIEQIIMNLSVNARDAMPQGGKLSIRTQNVILDDEYCKTHLGCKPGPYVLLSVSDTGHGMDRETCEHMFEPFFTTKDPGEGTGLGLAVVYGIVKLHGGYIMCYSEPDKGTTFSIYFPSLVSGKETERPAAEPFPQGGTETILLVDDEALIRDLGERILRKAGYAVLTASNGKEALELYERERSKIGLVILDLIMPEMGGMDCLEEILSLNPKARVLVASGFAMDGPARDALVAGARGFVGKPYDVARVLQTVRDALDAS